MAVPSHTPHRPGRQASQVAERLRAEFREMPCMRLNVEQVCRLCGVDPAVCQAVLDTLVAENVLRLTADGCYVRADDHVRAGRRIARRVRPRVR
jgi:hypothetical protein